TCSPSGCRTRRRAGASWWTTRRACTGRSDRRAELRRAQADGRMRPSLAAETPGRPDTAPVDTPSFALPTRDGLPVLSPLQQRIEARATLGCLQRQLEQDVGHDAAARRSVLRNVDLLLAEELGDTDCV